MSEATPIGETRTLSGRAWPERPGPQDQEREAVSEATPIGETRTPSGRAWPERPGPQDQEREASARRRE